MIRANASRKPLGRLEPRIELRVDDALARADGFERRAQAPRARVLDERHAEALLKLAPRRRGVHGERVEVGVAPAPQRLALDGLDEPADDVGRLVRVRQRTAARARPIGGEQRGLRVGEELAVLALRLAGRAGRPAEDARRAHAYVEDAVVVGIAAEQRGVARVLIERQLCLFHGGHFTAANGRCRRFSRAEFGSGGGRPGRRGAAVLRRPAARARIRAMRVAILDDIHRAWEGTDGVRRLRERAEVKIFTEPFGSPAALRGFDALVANRERTKFTRALLEQLVDVRVIAQTGNHAAHLDFAAAHERGIVVAQASGGYSIGAAELTIGLAIAVMRQIPAPGRRRAARLLAYAVYASAARQDARRDRLGARRHARRAHRESVRHARARLEPALDGCRGRSGGRRAPRARRAARARPTS